MGLFSSSAKSIGDALKRSAAGSYIAKIVQEQYIEQASATGTTEDDFPLITAAMAVECNLHGCAQLLLDQARADGHHQLTLVEVHRTIVETIRDAKLKIWEFDGTVNPLDLLTIKGMAAPLKIKARSALLNAQMKAKARDAAGLSAMLDVVEEDLIGTAFQNVADDDKVKQMRTAQAAIWAVSELRLQQLAPPGN